MFANTGAMLCPSIPLLCSELDVSFFWCISIYTFHYRSQNPGYWKRENNDCINKYLPLFPPEVLKDAGNHVFLSVRWNLPPCFCLTTGMHQQLLQPRLLRRSPWRWEFPRAEWCLGAGENRMRRTSVRYQFGAQKFSSARLLPWGELQMHRVYCCSCVMGMALKSK